MKSSIYQYYVGISKIYYKLRNYAMVFIWVIHILYYVISILAIFDPPTTLPIVINLGILRTLSPPMEMT